MTTTETVEKFFDSNFELSTDLSITDLSESDDSTCFSDADSEYRNVNEHTKEEHAQHEHQEGVETPNNVNEDTATSLPGLTVLGLYGRTPKPGIELLPPNYTEKDMKPEQFMSRRRLNTKPLHYENSNSNTSNDDMGKYEDAMFEPVKGLVNHEFWHMTPSETTASHGYLFEDRAILFQAKEHYDQLSKEPRFSSCFDDYLNTPYFGEQVIVKGYDASQLAVGDVFEVEGGLSPLVVEVTSPRRPCYHVDKRNNTPMGDKGMKRHTLSEGLAGWFTRVIAAGELRDGMKLVRTSHPNPKWTMAYLSEVMYKEGSKKSMMACKAEWVRDKEELIELLNLPQLGNYEWKDEARKLLKEIEKVEKKDNPPVALTVNGIYGRERITNYDHELPPNYTVNDMQNDQFMPRYRYLTKPIVEDPCENDSLKYDNALFVPNVGLVGIWTDFWHTNYKKTGTVHADRAVLFQSVENYEILKNDPKFESCFDKHQYAYLSDPSFGEQVIIQGCDSSQIAIGDVFEVEGGFSKLVIEVSAPRKPGYSLDRRHGTPMGENGIKRHCLTNGLAGWFTRVLVTGELREGMTLIRTKHPNPKWTLSYISNALYGEGDTATVNRCQGHWKRSKRELIEMINLPQLGNHQWKDEGKKVLAKMETENDARIGNRICSSSVVHFMTRCFQN